MLLFVIVCGVVFALGGKVHADTGYDDHLEDVPQYAYGYQVKDDYTGNYFTQKESRDGYATQGEYSVQLPDGRLQIVRYVADENGYRAEVSYEGTAHYPDVHGKGSYSHHKPVYKPPPSYLPRRKNTYDYDEPSYKPKVTYKEPAYIPKKIYDEPAYNPKETYDGSRYIPEKSYIPRKTYEEPTYIPSYKEKPSYSTRHLPTYRQAYNRPTTEYQPKKYSAHKAPSTSRHFSSPSYRRGTYKSAYSYLPSYAPRAEYNDVQYDHVPSYSNHRPTYIRPSFRRTKKPVYSQSYAPGHQAYSPRSYHV
ncbi:unnamed protein product [Cyprideis torosa]|uniref:Uncharacterized protein n=1 Tax=Cyprideis torosa TaxID=163714 RepID=A0A7R8ZMJ5_9CRUS|nr:unnamed protein product [Cyprideis torosa]CAG0895630.1 unnamed protein product [Cyprideis torosa]